MVEAEGTFVLGVGAQKAGTTWLYRYLAGSRLFVGGYRKEYHVFDVVDLPNQRWQRDRTLARAEESLNVLRRGGTGDAAVFHRLSMISNTAHYFDYFASLLLGRGGPHVTADITPAYAMLSSERFREVREEFSARRIKTVPVFLMRDPVDRIWSQIRMQSRRRTEESHEEPTEEHLLDLHRLPQFRDRSRYDLTIAALDAAFGDDVHYAFYETFFSTESVGRLCRAVGIESHRPDFDTRANADPNAVRVSATATKVVAESLADVYLSVARRFPQLDLRAMWPSAQFVL